MKTFQLDLQDGYAEHIVPYLLQLWHKYGQKVLAHKEDWEKCKNMVNLLSRWN